MILTVQHLEKYFGAQVCLKDISFQLDAQDRVGIIGENGAGKTTLIQCITGEYEPDAGELVFAKGTVVGYLRQNSVLDPTQTVYGEMENAFRPVLDAMQEMQALEKRMEQGEHDEALLERHDRLQSIVDAADGYHMDTQIKKILNGMAFAPETYEKRVSVLSGGEHTRLCLAKLLLQRPDLLILDEPVSGLDPKATADMYAMIESLNQKDGITIIMVSHDVQAALAYPTHILHLGETVFFGTREAYLESSIGRRFAAWKGGEGA